MAKKRRKTSKRVRKGDSGGHVTGRARRGNDNAAVRGMAMGGLIILLAALFFFLRVGGATPFNHLLDLFKSDGPTVPVKAPEASAMRGAPARARRSPRPARVARNALKAKPMEAVGAADQAGLDKLIEARAK